MFPISDEKIYDLINLIYDTTVKSSPANWLQVYKTISETFSSGPGSLSYYQNDKNNFGTIASTLDDELFQQYNNYHYKISPFRRKIEKMETGEIFNRSQNCSDRTFLKTEIYQEIYKKQDVFYFDYEVLFNEKNVSGGITFSRPQTMENFSKQEYKAIRFIIPHIRRAFQTFYKIGQNRKKNQIMAEVLDTISQSVVIAGESGEIFYINDNARKIVDKNDGLQIDCKGSLVAGSIQDAKKLKKILASVFKSDFNQKVNYGGTVQISRPSGLRPFSVLVSPIINQPVFSSKSESFALIFITDPEQNIEIIDQVLCDLYELTPSECKLVSILVQGESLKEACELLNVTNNTVRTHLKHIFSKTDTRRQSDLVRLILTGPASLQKTHIK